MSHYAGTSIACHFVNAGFHQIAANCPKVSRLSTALRMHRGLIELKLDADGLICIGFCFVGNNLAVEDGGFSFELEVSIVSEVEELCGLVVCHLSTNKHNPSTHKPKRRIEM